MNLLENVQIKSSLHGSTHGAGITGSTWLDMAGWGGCLFILTKASSQIGSSGEIVIRNSSAASTGAGCLASTFTELVHFATGPGNNPVAIDVVKPIKRYLSLRLLTCTGIKVTSLQYFGRMRGTTEAKAVLQTISAVHHITT